MSGRGEEVVKKLCGENYDFFRPASARNKSREIASHKRMAALHRIVMTMCSILVAAHAGGVEYEVTGVFTNSALSGQIASGDTYVCRIAINDSVPAHITEDSLFTTNSLFSNALTSVDFRLLPGSTGSYGGGRCTNSLRINVLESENISWIYNFATNGFGTFNGFPLLVTVYLIDRSHSSQIDFTRGATFRDIVGRVELNQFPDSYVLVTAGKSNAWATIASLTPIPGPRLSIFQMAGGQIRLRWPTNQPDFNLEASFDLSESFWRPVLPAPVTNQGQLEVVVPPEFPARYYRLKRQ